METLHDAARYGDVEAVEDFIAVGKDVNARAILPSARPCTTPSPSARARPARRSSSSFVEANSDLTAVDEKKNTPLHYACGYGKIFAVKALLEKGCDITAQNGTGRHPWTS